MKIKDVIKMEKEKMPRYEYKYQYYFVLPSIIFILVGAIAVYVLTTVLIENNGEIFTSYLPVYIWLAVISALLITIMVLRRKIDKRLIGEKAEELEKTYFDVEEGEYLSQLKEKKIVDEQGFFIYDFESDYDGETPPLDENGKQLNKRDALIMFFATFDLFTTFIQVAVIDQKTGKIISAPLLSNELDNYIRKNGIEFLNKPVYDLFSNDKTEFIKNLIKYKNTDDISKRLEKQTQTKVDN